MFITLELSGVIHLLLVDTMQKGVNKHFPQTKPATSVVFLCTIYGHHNNSRNGVQYPVFFWIMDPIPGSSRDSTPPDAETGMSTSPLRRQSVLVKAESITRGQTPVIDLGTSSASHPDSGHSLPLPPTPRKRVVVIDPTSPSSPPVSAPSQHPTARPSPERNIQQQFLDQRNDSRAGKSTCYTEPGTSKYNPLSLLGKS